MYKLTQKLVRSLFNYKDGNLYWKVRSQGINIDDKAGSLHSRGYYQIKINNKLYKTHRLIFLYHHGYLPKEIDHIDNNKQNNLIENLREVTHIQNIWNSQPHNNSSSKYKGVSWDKQHQKWRVRITIKDNKRKFLGLFNDEKAAAFIYNVYAKIEFGEYAYLNNIKGN